MCCRILPIFSGDIEVGDLDDIFRYGNTIDTLEIEGKYLLQALEKSVSEYYEVPEHGRFLHFTGRLTFRY